MASRRRWRRAQAYELNFWQRNAWMMLPGGRGLTPPHLDFVESCGLEGKRVLEVGCGPMGPVFFTPGSVRVGIDPLAREYMSLVNFATQGVHLVAGVGESLPIRTGAFDVVIVGNVLDHVHHPDRTLTEIRRVLKPGGLLLLWMHVIPSLLVPLRGILNAIDGGHPYHMTKDEAYDLLLRAQLQPQDGRTESPGLGWRSGWKAAGANLIMRTLICKAHAVSGVEPVAVV